MIEQFTTEKQFFDWLDARLRESSPVQGHTQSYAAMCRAFDGGLQHIQSTGINEKGLQRFVNNYDQAQIVGGREPARVTMNRITSQRIRNAARTNPIRFEVVDLPSPAMSNPQQTMIASIMQSVGNACIDYTNLVESCQRCNTERSVTAMHGFGFRINRSQLPNGKADADMEAFEFDGYQLALDPANKSLDLMQHEYVILSEIMTKAKASRVYGDGIFDGIKDEELKPVRSLMPMEMAFHKITGGAMYAEFAQHADQPAVVIRTVWVRGPGKRFNRMYLTMDTTSGRDQSGKKLISDIERPVNPYGGHGMPLGLLRGFDRSGSRQPISDVGMMIDDQRKANLSATILFQGYWNYVNLVWLMDRNWIQGGHNMTNEQIWDQIESGLLVGRGSQHAKAPQIATPPSPPQWALENTQLFAEEMRQGVFSSDTHQGKTKSHVPNQTVQLAFQAAEAPLQDREERDIKEYTRVIETMGATAVLLVKAVAPSMIKMLERAGVTAEQIGALFGVDHTEQPRYRLTETAMRRQTRTQRYQTMLDMLDRGAYDPSNLPQFFADIDMPLRTIDRKAKEFAEAEVARIFAGGVYDPIPLGQGVGFMLDALQLGMMQTQDPEVRGRLLGAMDAQIEIDGLNGGDEEAQQPPAGPDEVDLQQLVGGL